MDSINPLNCIDFYKYGHKFQYPKGTNLVYANFTARSDRHATHIFQDHPETPKLVFFGLQGILKWLFGEVWQRGFFDKPKEVVVKAFQDRMVGSLGPGAGNVDHIAALHDLGYLPVEIRALPEGSLVPFKVPLFTIHNTLPEFYWITNFLEDQLSSENWKNITNTTIAYQYRKLFDKYARETGGDPGFCQWQGHDFSARGMSGIYDAAKSGASHLVSFSGTDTVSAIDYVDEYYGTKGTFVAGSVPATEHSVMCTGSKETELETYKRLLTEIYPTGIVSVVSDTWDYWKVLTEYLPQLKGLIMARDGKLVIRPDSGSPELIINGDDEAKPFSPEAKGSLQLLWEVFGGTVNEKGYKVLDPHIGLIYGDSITPSLCKEILEGMKENGFCSSNIVLGIGSFTYNYNTRDTFGFALKSTYAEVNGKPVEIFKDPATDSGTKKSLKGLVQVSRGEKTNEFVVKDQCTWEESQQGELQPVYRNGMMLRGETLQSIRSRLGTF
jgi:nicotinamide phosphoribosyltransferase